MLRPKKNSCGSKIPLPTPPPLPHNFSNGPSLSGDRTEFTMVVLDYITSLKYVL